MKVQTILFENNNDKEFTTGFFEGILASYNITDYAVEAYTSKYITYQFITTETTLTEILNILKKKHFKYKVANTKIELN